MQLSYAQLMHYVSRLNKITVADVNKLEPVALYLFLPLHTNKNALMSYISSLLSEWLRILGRHLTK
jgi:hypothetical protein